MLKAGKIKIGHTKFTLVDTGEVNSLHIERIFVSKNERRKGYATADLKELANLADRFLISLSANICPDEDDYEINLGLRRAFAKSGFKPLTLGSDVYPNDQLRSPKSGEEQAKTIKQLSEINESISTRSATHS